MLSSFYLNFLIFLTHSIRAVYSIKTAAVKGPLYSLDIEFHDVTVEWDVSKRSCLSHVENHKNASLRCAHYLLQFKERSERKILRTQSGAPALPNFPMASIEVDNMKLLNTEDNSSSEEENIVRSFFSPQGYFADMGNTYFDEKDIVVMWDKLDPDENFGFTAGLELGVGPARISSSKKTEMVKLLMLPHYLKWKGLVQLREAEEDGNSAANYSGNNSQKSTEEGLGKGWLNFGWLFGDMISNSSAISGPNQVSSELGTALQKGFSAWSDRFSSPPK